MNFMIYKSYINFLKKQALQISNVQPGCHTNYLAAVVLKSVLSRPAASALPKNLSQIHIPKVTPDLVHQKCLNKTWCTIKFENCCPQKNLRWKRCSCWFQLKGEKTTKNIISLYYFTHNSHSVIQSSKKKKKWKMEKNKTTTYTSITPK